MRYIQLFISFAVLRLISLFFCAWSISGSPTRFNELLLRRDILSPIGEINIPPNLIAADPQDSPSEPNVPETTPIQPSELLTQQPQPQQQQSQSAPEPVPNPQPAPAPPPESQPLPAPVPQIPRPLPVSQLLIIDQSPPGSLGPSNPGTVAPLPVPVSLPIPPLVPIVPVPPPLAQPSPSPVPQGQTPQRPRLVPQPVSGSVSSTQLVGGSAANRPKTEVPKTPSIIVPGVGDYPSDDQIRNDMFPLPPDTTVMFTEIGGMQPVRRFAERATPHKLLYSDVFPYGYTWSNGRSGEFHQDFLDRLCAI